MLFNKTRDFILSLLDVLVTETMEDGILIVLNLSMGKEVPEDPVPGGLDGIIRDLSPRLAKQLGGVIQVEVLQEFHNAAVLLDHTLDHLLLEQMFEYAEYMPWLRGWMTEVVFFGR